MNRREFVTLCAGAAGGVLFPKAHVVLAQAKGGNQTELHGDSGQPNIVLFLVDDMGWQDTSVAFHTERTVWNELYRTPNMQRLADQGMRFTNAYAASPVCSPTRVSLMTGRNPARTHVSDWVGHGIAGNRHVKAPDWAVTGLQPGRHVTLPQILRENGYRTIHVGKAHFGGVNTAGADPTRLGFDINIAGGHTGGPDGSYFLPWNPSRHPGLEDYPAGTYISDALTLEANKTIDQAVDDRVPFFLNMAHYAVHAPLSGQGDPDYMDPYKDRPNPEDDYAALLESMDASLGPFLTTSTGMGLPTTRWSFSSPTTGACRTIPAMQVPPIRPRAALPCSMKGTDTICPSRAAKVQRMKAACASP